MQYYKSTFTNHLLQQYKRKIKRFSIRTSDDILNFLIYPITNKAFEALRSYKIRVRIN